MNVSDTRSSLKKVQFEESKFDNFLRRHKQVEWIWKFLTLRNKLFLMKKINLEHKYF